MSSKRRYTKLPIKKQDEILCLAIFFQGIPKSLMFCWMQSSSKTTQISQPHWKRERSVLKGRNLLMGHNLLTSHKKSDSVTTLVVFSTNVQNMWSTDSTKFISETIKRDNNMKSATTSAPKANLRVPTEGTIIEWSMLNVSKNHGQYHEVIIHVCCECSQHNIPLRIIGRYSLAIYFVKYSSTHPFSVWIIFTYFFKFLI